MKKIKKRPGWIKSLRPFLGSAPKEPQTNVELVTEIELENIGNYSRCDLNSLKLPPGKTLADVSITIDAYGPSDNISAECRFLVTEIRTIDNPHYECEMKRYKKEFIDYQIKKTNYENEVKEWKLWVKQEKEEFQLKQIENAKKVLKDAGIIIE